MSVETRNITKLFGKQKAVNNVSFRINNGELVGLLGPNGAGKSTLMKIITGFLPFDTGEVFIDNKKIEPTDTIDIRKKIGYLPEQNPLYTDLYIKESLEITAGFYGLKNKKQRISEMIELTGLGDEQHKKIGALSKGYRQRVGLAQALIHNPSILIFDEPTTGLDPNQLEEIRELIREVGREKTVILSSHIMQEVEAVCTRAIIIKKGEIVADGGIETLKSRTINRRQTVVAGFDKPVTRDRMLTIYGVENATFENGIWKIDSAVEDDIRPAIFNFAVENNLTLLTLREKQQNLENVFQDLTQ